MENRTFTCYLPLWGLGFESEETGIVGGMVLGGKPYQDEWQKILKSDVLKEYATYQNIPLWEVEPQFCLSTTYRLSQGETLYDGIGLYQGEIYNQIRDALLALRLYKKGWIIDPYLVEYTYMDSGNYIVRVPGPYRQIFIAGFENDFPEFYKLQPNDLAYSIKGNGPLQSIFNLISQYRQSGGNQSVEIAIENFELSYSLPGNISWEQKISSLFTSMDAMLGGMSLHFSKGKYYLRETKMELFFRERIQKVLVLCGYPEAENESKWVDSLRKLRNSIAHGSRSDLEEEAKGEFERFQDVVRSILKHYMAFALRYKTLKHQIAKILKVEPTISLTEMYNKALEVSCLDDKIPDGIWHDT